jgi:hypothetical protein
LFWLEFRRSQGYWLLPIMVGLIFFSGFYQNFDGVVLWRELSFASLRSYAAIAPLAAAFAAWLADRERRRRTRGLVDSLPIPPVLRDLVNLGIASVWGLIGYGLVGAWFAWKGITEATWGGPDLGLIAAGALTIPIFAGIGGLVGRLVPSKFSPILAMGATFFLTIGADAYTQTTAHYQPDGTPGGYSFEQPLQLLMPWGLTMANWSEVSTPLWFVPESILWLTGLLSVVIAVTALVRKRSIAGWIALAISVGISGFAAVPLIERESRLSLWEQTSTVSFTWSCQTQSGIEVCVHPAYVAKLDESSEFVGNVLSPIAGLDGVPSTWRQSGPWRELSTEDGLLGGFDWRNQLWAIVDEVFPTTHDEFIESGGRPASQLAILQWLTDQSGQDDMDAWFFGYPVEVSHTEASTEGLNWYPPEYDEAELAAFQPQFNAVVARFTALPETDQRAWLEANWDALRAGTLTLDNLP